jgi:protein translocase SecG subunit
MNTINLLTATSEMESIELISAILLILSCVFIIVIVFFQGGGKSGMSQTITGQNSDNYYQRNSGRSKEMKLKKMTVAAAVLFFTVALAVNIIAVHSKDEASAPVNPPAADGGFDFGEIDLGDLGLEDDGHVHGPDCDH